MITQFPNFEHKLALIICNTNHLSSVILDANKLPPYLMRLGFKLENIHLIISNSTDNSKSTNLLTKVKYPYKLCTSATHFEELVADVVKKVTSRTSFFIHISSHGNTSGGNNECVMGPDGRIECDGNEYIPFNWNGRTTIYTDDKLHSMLVQPLPRNAEVMALIDTCHSGTMLDLCSSIITTKQGEKIKAKVVRNLDAKTVQCNVVCFSPTVDRQVTYEDVYYRGGLMTNMFTDTIDSQLKSFSSIGKIDLSIMLIESQRTASIINQSVVLSCSDKLKPRYYDVI